MEDLAPGQNLFTCLSCAIAFFSADDQSTFNQVSFKQGRNHAKGITIVRGPLPV